MMGRCVRRAILDEAFAWIPLPMQARKEEEGSLADIAEEDGGEGEAAASGEEKEASGEGEKSSGEESVSMGWCVGGRYKRSLCAFCVSSDVLAGTDRKAFLFLSSISFFKFSSFSSFFLDVLLYCCGCVLVRPLSVQLSERILTVR